MDTLRYCKVSFGKDIGELDGSHIIHKDEKYNAVMSSTLVAVLVPESTDVYVVTIEDKVGLTSHSCKTYHEVIEVSKALHESEDLTTMEAIEVIGLFYIFDTLADNEYSENE